MKFLIFFLIFFIKSNLIYADNKIAYIDLNFILTKSLVGKYIENHMSKIQKENLSNFKKQEEILNEKETKLISQKNILEKQKFDYQVILLKQEINKYRDERKKINTELNKKKISYTKKVLLELNPIITNFVEENSISIVLPKKNIIVGKKDLDITSDILNLLNNKIKIIEF